MVIIDKSPALEEKARATNFTYLLRSNEPIIMCEDSKHAEFARVAYLSRSHMLRGLYEPNHMPLRYLQSSKMSNYVTSVALTTLAACTSSPSAQHRRTH